MHAAPILAYLGGAVTAEADRLRTRPGHTLGTGETYVVATATSVGRLLLTVYRLALSATVAIVIYAGIYNYAVRGLAVDHFGFLATLLCGWSWALFRLTRGLRWSVFYMPDGLGEVEQANRFAAAAYQHIVWSVITLGVAAFISVLIYTPLAT